MKRELILPFCLSIYLTFYFLNQYYQFNQYQNNKISFKPYLNISQYSKKIVYSLYMITKEIEMKQ